MKGISRFNRWVEQNAKRRGLLCHFYIDAAEKSESNERKQKQYFTKSDYAYFNLLVDSQNWMVKGTTNHGITDNRGNRSKVPVLNCFEIDNVFCEALNELDNSGNKIFQLGLILNKRKLKGLFGKDNVRKVKEWKWKNKRPRPSRDQSWLYDITHRRKGVLDPFNFCKVVRIKIPNSRLRKIPIRGIPISILMALLVRKEDFDAVSKLPKITENNIAVFPLL